MNEHILIIDDDEILRESLCAVLNNRGYRCSLAATGKQALQKILDDEFDVVLCDLELPDMSGIEVIEQASAINARLAFMIITAYASVETAIEALRKGAYDYMIKPLNFEDVALKISKLLEHKNLLLENQALRQEIHRQYDFSNIVGKSRAIRRVFEQIKMVSQTESNVLITGKSGTGKELVARAIHFNSPRRKGPFVAINCGAITESLVESELFGHKRGAFTGAVQDKDGFFKAANHGTLFLDEIGEIPLPAQVKLLRALEEKEIIPVGGTQPIHVDVRIIAATNRNLFEEVQAGRFREDLYYRLNIVEIVLPSLSERREDIPLLVNHFIQKYNRQMNKQIRGVEPKVNQILMNHSWRGEVRELENIIERAMIFCTGDVIKVEHLPPDLQKKEPAELSYPSQGRLKDVLRQFEREYILHQLRKNGFSRRKTARALGIGEATLYRKLNDLAIDALEAGENG
ncbi:MAG TPA: sigma-54-dependent Fis family transcriptional regulator [Bacteroidetes bacterium]|nr:sigma-54-dependent Fis family transcriptional regulator [Bacteroidota bacterium]